LNMMWDIKTEKQEPVQYMWIKRKA
jgi:hypothetical protein